MTDFSNPVYTELNVVSAKCPFLHGFSAIRPFDYISFWLVVFRSDVFQPYVRSAICLSAISPTTTNANSRLPAAKHRP